MPFEHAVVRLIPVFTMSIWRSKPSYLRQAPKRSNNLALCVRVIDGTFKVWEPAVSKSCVHNSKLNCLSTVFHPTKGVKGPFQERSRQFWHEV
jgi:hypothetical protein